MEYKIGTRGSALALAQTHWVKQRLEQAYPEDRFTIVVIKTKGDRIQHIALDKIGDKGLFVKEIETQLLDRHIDLAVHSMKDMPSQEVEGLCFADAWECEDARDALILREGGCLASLPPHAKIGTGSKRRAFQMQKLRADVTCVGIRGNVETRLRKMEEEKLDGIIMAAAGLRRLGLEDRISHLFSCEEMVPACTQGILGIQCRKDDEQLLDKLNALSSEQAKLRCDIERAYLQAMEGSCHVPSGAHAQILDGKLLLHFVHGKEDGTNLQQLHLRGPLEEKDTLLKEAITRIKGKKEH